VDPSLGKADVSSTEEGDPSFDTEESIDSGRSGEGIMQQSAGM